MDRRKSLKLIATGAVAVPAVIAGCKPDDKKVEEVKPKEADFPIHRSAEEMKYENLYPLGLAIAALILAIVSHI